MCARERGVCVETHHRRETSYSSSHILRSLRPESPLKYFLRHTPARTHSYTSWLCTTIAPACWSKVGATLTEVQEASKFGSEGFHATSSSTWPWHGWMGTMSVQLCACWMRAIGSPCENRNWNLNTQMEFVCLFVLLDLSKQAGPVLLTSWCGCRSVARRCCFDVEPGCHNTISCSHVTIKG